MMAKPRRDGTRKETAIYQFWLTHEEPLKKIAERFNVSYYRVYRAIRGPLYWSDVKRAYRRRSKA